MPTTKTTYYLGTRYEVTHSYDRWSGYGPPAQLLWRNVRITRDGEVIGQDLSEHDLSDLWRTFQRRMYRARSPRATATQEFFAYLRALVSDPETVDDLGFCDHCNEPEWRDALQDNLCETCIDDYYSHCERCGDLTCSDYVTETLGNDYICDHCRDNYYSYCDDCEGYYPDGYSYDHDHDSGSGCCESPQQVFTVRNDGNEPLANDTRVSVTLPAGTISPAGLRALRDYLRNEGHFSIAEDLHTIGDQWQAKQGNFAKRLSRMAYQTHAAKLTPEIMSQVGCIARDHSTAVNVEIEVTRDLNQSAAYFYHDDSCYWGSYSESRCALKTNGAYGIRSFDRYGEVSGRAWVMPLRQALANPGLSGKVTLAPTFDTMRADAFVVFNGYGDLGGYAAARIMAHMSGCTYRKIGFDCDPIYINAGGYLVAPEHIAGQYTDGSLQLSVRQHSSLYESEMSHA